MIGAAVNYLICWNMAIIQILLDAPLGRVKAHCKVYRHVPLLFGKLEFGGESPLTMRAQCSTYRHCPNPLGIVPAEQFDKLEFVEE